MTDDILQKMHQKLDEIRDVSLDMALRLDRAMEVVAVFEVNIRFQLNRPSSEDRPFLEACANQDIAHFLETGVWRDKEKADV